MASKRLLKKNTKKSACAFSPSEIHIEVSDKSRQVSTWTEVDDLDDKRLQTLMLKTKKIFFVGFLAFFAISLPNLPKLVLMDMWLSLHWCSPSANSYMRKGGCISPLTYVLIFFLVYFPSNISFVTNNLIFFSFFESWFKSE